MGGYIRRANKEIIFDFYIGLHNLIGEREYLSDTKFTDLTADFISKNFCFSVLLL